VLALMAAAGAEASAPGRAAIAYPPPKDPGKLPPRANGKRLTLHVCRDRRRCFRAIQRAVDAARGGDTIRVADGTYREGVTIANPGRRGLRIVGNRRHPGRVVLDGRRLAGQPGENAFFVRGVDRVTIAGFTARDYRTTGFLVVGATGYTLTDLVARRTGDYGLYAFDSRGGEMSDSDASQAARAAFAIGQTPRQTKPKRTLVRRVRGHESVTGFSATNMRYVTIAGSEFFNDAVGIAMSAVDSERHPPPEQNTIAGNDVFWNNFDYLAGAPFEAPAGYNPGFGILLLGGRDTTVEDNRVYGNWMAGYAATGALGLTRHPPAAALERNVLRANAFGLDGADLNGIDLAYDGSGVGNCFDANTGVATTLPASGSTLTACPFDGANAFDDDARADIVERATGADPEARWQRHDHAPKPGYEPIVRWGESR
jgi:hypothetical protein